MGIIINGQNDTIGPVDNSMSLLGTVSIGGTMTIEDFTNIDSVGVITARNGIDVTGGTVTITSGTNSASPAGSGDNLVIKDSDGCGLSILSGNGNSQNIYLGSVSDNDVVRLEGFYNSGSPYFNIYTGGSQRLRITSDGKIGVNKTPTTYQFEVNGGTANTVASFESTDATSRILFKDNSGEAMVGAVGDALTFYTSTNATERLRIDSSGNLLLKTGEIDIQGGNKTVKTSAGFLQLGTSGSHHTAIITAGSERLRITSDGKMGLGISSPARGGLHIHKASTAELHLTDDTTGSGSGDGLTVFSTISSAGVWYRENANLRFATNNTERMIITSGGNVDINGTPPWSVTGGNYRNLSISGNDASSSGFLWLGNGAAATNADFDLGRVNFVNGTNIVAQIKGTTQTSANDDGRISFLTKSTGSNISERLRITSAGFVGINETSPTNLLHVDGGTDQLKLSDGSGSFEFRAGNALIIKDNGTERLRIDSAGNMGLGVSPIAPGYTTLHIGETTSGDPVRLQMSTANTGHATSDGFTLSIDGSSSAVNLIQREGAPIQFYTNNSERMRVFGTGACLQINTTSTPTTGGFQLPQISIKQTASNWTGGIHIESSGSTKMGCIASTEDGLELSQSYRSGTNYGQIIFRTSGVVRSKLLNNGYFQMGSGYLGSTAYHRFNGINDTQGDTFFVLSGYQGSGGSSGDTAIFHSCNAGASVSSSATAMKIFRNSSTSRSINASGTINASGADYAEYMTKAGNFTLAKGDVCGVNSEGKLTNVFADAISFVVKSTDPSYVGGDKWHEVAGEQPGGYDDTRTEEEIAAAKVVYEEALESARQLVDRIAFSGQVPVNVTGATPGQHIIPTAASDGSIEGTAKAEADLTMAEYMSSVGKVIAIEDDGRARIIVKVA